MSYGAHWGSERPSPWGRELGTTTMSNLSWLLGNPSQFKPWSHRFDRDGRQTPVAGRAAPRTDQYWLLRCGDLLALSALFAVCHFFWKSAWRCRHPTGKIRRSVDGRLAWETQR